MMQAFRYDRTHNMDIPHGSTDPSHWIISESITARAQSSHDPGAVLNLNLLKRTDRLPWISGGKFPDLSDFLRITPSTLGLKFILCGKSPGHCPPLFFGSIGSVRVFLSLSL